MDEVSAAQAAMLLGLSERTIRRKIASGKLPARRVAPNRFAIAVRDLPRRRDMNDLARRLEALERRVALLEEQQRAQQVPRSSWDAAADGADSADVAAPANGAAGASTDELSQLLAQLAHEVERFAPLLVPLLPGERDQDVGASARTSGAWPGAASGNAAG